jgi:hypothetical protein
MGPFVEPPCPDVCIVVKCRSVCVHWCALFHLTHVSVCCDVYICAEQARPVCPVTPTFAATRCVTKRHVTWAVRDKCKEFQTHLEGKTAVVLGVTKSGCSEVYPLFFSLSQDHTVSIIGTDECGLIYLMMDAASCSLCGVLLWLVRYATLELNSSTKPSVDVTKEQKSACIGAYRTAFAYVYSLKGTEKRTASNTAHCSGQWNVVTYTVALRAKVLCTCKVAFLLLVTFQRRRCQSDATGTYCTTRYKMCP